MVITEAIPMTMPRTDKAVRTLLLVKLINASSNIVNGLMGLTRLWLSCFRP